MKDSFVPVTPEQIAAAKFLIRRDAERHILSDDEVLAIANAQPLTIIESDDTQLLDLRFDEVEPPPRDSLLVLDERTNRYGVAVPNAEGDFILNYTYEKPDQFDDAHWRTPDVIIPKRSSSPADTYGDVGKIEYELPPAVEADRTYQYIPLVDDIDAANATFTPPDYALIRRNTTELLLPSDDHVLGVRTERDWSGGVPQYTSNVDTVGTEEIFPGTVRRQVPGIRSARPELYSDSQIEAQDLDGMNSEPESNILKRIFKKLRD